MVTLSFFDLNLIKTILASHNDAQNPETGFTEKTFRYFYDVSAGVRCSFNNKSNGKMTHLHEHITMLQLHTKAKLLVQVF